MGETELVTDAPSTCHLSPVYSHLSPVIMIRGDLEVTILEARDLPDTDNFLFGMFKEDVTDPFVSGYLDTTKIFMTSIKDNTLNPIWNEKFHIPLCHQAVQLRLDVSDKDHTRNEAIGSVWMSLAQLCGDGVEGWHTIMSSRGKRKGELNFSAKFTSSKDLMTKYYE